jgi:hypothetical protein
MESCYVGKARDVDTRRKREMKKETVDAVDTALEDICKISGKPVLPDKTDMVLSMMILEEMKEQTKLLKSIKTELEFISRDMGR